MHAAWQSVSPTVFMGFILITVMAHLVFSTKAGLMVSVGLLIASSLIDLPRLLPLSLATGDTTLLIALFRNELFFGIIIILQYVLARSKDEHLEAQQLAQEMTVLAYQDVLTHLPNRRWLEEELARQLRTAERYERPLSVITFDLDRFKVINDSYGHEVGDAFLKEIASIIGPMMLAGDVFGRWGGEEFLIIAPDTPAEAAGQLAERVRATIEAHRFPHDLALTASFGVAMRGIGMDALELLRQADDCLYSAKREGRNRVHVAHA